MKRWGVSLIELLVVVSIVGLLISLLVPAIQSAREAARLVRCQNNLRQLALGLTAYHTAHGAFPPASCIDGTVRPGRTTEWKQNWVISVLPHIDQQALHDSFRLDKLIRDDENRLARGTRLPLMLCPTDVGSDVLYGREGEGDNWARGNYGANGSLMQAKEMERGSQYMLWWEDKRVRGVMGVNASLSMADITDGASNTVLLGELRIGVCDKDRRGTWAMSCVGASSIFGHAVTDDLGPNCDHEIADDLIGCNDVIASYGRRNLIDQCMGCLEAASDQATMRSQHSDGVNSVFCDGSTHFLSNSIDQRKKDNSADTFWKLTYPDDFHVWERINASADGLVVDGSTF